ncbi:MAG: hypothetical protein QNJ32_00245 [Xenococcaceae cyanobacterium MO_167.B27]|nr:hypothetical protein [Xenococcaceae cyanobacterium MO_167.B27]
MLAGSLLVLSICLGMIILSIHERDEIHQLVAWLSGLMALVCFFILTPPVIKGLLGLLFVAMGHKIFPAYRSFK